MSSKRSTKKATAELRLPPPSSSSSQKQETYQPYLNNLMRNLDPAITAQLNPAQLQSLFNSFLTTALPQIMQMSQSTNSDAPAAPETVPKKRKHDSSADKNINGQHHPLQKLTTGKHNAKISKKQKSSKVKSSIDTDNGTSLLLSNKDSFIQPGQYTTVPSNILSNGENNKNQFDNVDEDDDFIPSQKLNFPASSSFNNIDANESFIETLESEDEDTFALTTPTRDSNLVDESTRSMGLASNFLDEHASFHFEDSPCSAADNAATEVSDIYDVVDLDTRAEIELLFAEHYNSLSPKEVEEQFPPIIIPDWQVSPQHLFSRDQVVELRNQLEQYFQLISTFYIAYQIKLFENNGTVVAEEAEEARIYEQELKQLYLNYKKEQDSRKNCSLPKLLPNLYDFPGLDKINEIINCDFSVIKTVPVKPYCGINASSNSLMEEVNNLVIQTKKNIEMETEQNKLPRSVSIKWSIFEDELLVQGLCYFGEDFNDIACYVLPSRTPIQSKSRLYNTSVRGRKPNGANHPSIVKDFSLSNYKPMTMLEIFILKLGIRCFKEDFVAYAESLFPIIPRYIIQREWERLYYHKEVDTAYPFPYSASNNSVNTTPSKEDFAHSGIERRGFINYSSMNNNSTSRPNPKLGGKVVHSVGRGKMYARVSNQASRYSIPRMNMGAKNDKEKTGSRVNMIKTENSNATVESASTGFQNRHSPIYSPASSIRFNSFSGNDHTSLSREDMEILNVFSSPHGGNRVTSNSEIIDCLSEPMVLPQSAPAITKKHTKKALHDRNSSTAKVEPVDFVKATSSAVIHPYTKTLPSLTTKRNSKVSLFLPSSSGIAASTNKENKRK